MQIVTFTSDLKDSNYKIAQIKATLISSIPKLTILDISNAIPSFDIEEGAFVLKSCYKNFPKETIHIFAINRGDILNNTILSKINGHYFISGDNGFPGLISDNENEIEYITKIDFTKFKIDQFSDPYGFIASELFSSNIKTMGIEHKKNCIILKNNHIRKSPNQLVGKVIYIDNYGNLISNIEISLIDTYLDSNFHIQIGREKIYQKSLYYSDLEDGDCFYKVNKQGMIKIGIYYGNASLLLGAQRNSYIIAKSEKPCLKNLHR